MSRVYTTAPSFWGRNGIIGLTQILPPALAWLWRLVSPRGFANPSIVDEGAMSSEGVGSYWPFATGKRVNQANLLLRQIMETPRVRYILCPNQHIGAWRVRFMPQWIMRGYLSRRGGAWFTENQIEPAPTALLHNFFEQELQQFVNSSLMPEGREIIQCVFDRKTVSDFEKLVESQSFIVEE
ncbi:MAG: DUF4914 family protein [Spirochaetia bacterium]